MGIKFKIEGKYKEGKKKYSKYFVFAKCLEMKRNFEITDNSRLGKVEISKFLTQPRIIDENRKPRFDVFIFKIRYKEDIDKLKVGQIVELINQN